MSRRVVSATALTVGAIAIAGGYLGSTARSPGPAVSDAPRQIAPTAPPPVPSGSPTAEIRGAYQPEVGPFALLWTWVADHGSLAVRGAREGSGYVGMLALSAGSRRVVRVGTSPPRTVDSLPRAYLFGPLVLADGEIPIRVSPGARRASTRDPRRISVFLSTPVVAHQPFAGVPGKGFYALEGAEGRTFHWMTGRGVLDLVAAPATNVTAVIRLRLWSPKARRLTIERVGSGTRKTIDLPRREVGTVTVGGVRLRAGRGRLTLTTDAPPPGRRDPRRLALQLLGVTRVQ